MSTNCSNLCNLLLQENFGKTVARVAAVFMTFGGSMALENIVVKTKLPIPKIKDCLKVLIQHNLVYYDMKSEGRSGIFYTLRIEDTLALIRYPKFITIVQKIGVYHCRVVEEVIRAGQTAASKVLCVLGLGFVKENKATLGKAKLHRELLEKLGLFLDAFEELAKRRYLIRTNIQQEACRQSQSSQALDFLMPKEINLKIIADKLLSNQLGSDELIDHTTLWKVNLAQFYNEIYYELIIEMLSEKAAELFEPRPVLEALFRCGATTDHFAEETAGVSLTKLQRELEKLPNSHKLINDLIDHLEILGDLSGGLISEIPTIEGSSFVVNLKLAAESLIWSLAETMVARRHSPQALRIFRLIKIHQYLDQEKIAQLSMLPAKDAKQITYHLIADNFVILKEMRKSYLASAMNNKVEYCFHIDIEQVAYQLRESCLKGIINTRIRTKDKKLKYLRLIRKQDKIEKILVNMVNQGCSEEQLKEIRDLITPPEQAILTRVESIVDKLTTSVFHLDNSIFLVNVYLHYRTRENKRRAMKTRGGGSINAIEDII